MLICHTSAFKEFRILHHKVLLTRFSFLDNYIKQSNNNTSKCSICNQKQEKICSICLEDFFCSKIVISNPEIPPSVVSCIKEKHCSFNITEVVGDINKTKLKSYGREQKILRNIEIYVLKQKKRSDAIKNLQHEQALLIKHFICMKRKYFEVIKSKNWESIFTFKESLYNILKCLENVAQEIAKKSSGNFYNISKM